MLILIIFGVALWIGCGVVSAGLCYGYDTRTYDWTIFEQYDFGKGITKQQHKGDVTFASLHIPLGLIALLSSLICFRPYRFHFRPPKHWKPYL